jgi:hypothetical protein
MMSKVALHFAAIGRYGTEDEHMDYWTPGNYGKGFVMNDGRVVTWNLDEHPSRQLESEFGNLGLGPEAMGPHHSDIATRIGLEAMPEGDYEELGFTAGGWHTPVYIKPDGTVLTLDHWPGADHGALNAFHQRGYKPHQEDTSWDFTSAWDPDDDEEPEFNEDEYLEQEGWLTPKPIEPLVNHVEHDKYYHGDHYDVNDDPDYDEGGELHDPNGPQHERPVIFDGQQFHVGVPNSYHWDLLEHPSMNDKFYNKFDRGSHGEPKPTDDLAMGRYNPATNGVVWVTKGKWRRDHFDDLAQRAFPGVYDESADMGFTDDDWHFGAIDWDAPEETEEEWEARLEAEMRADQQRRPTDDEIARRLSQGLVPGQQGKGLVLPDGNKVYWKTDGTFGWPHHDDVLRHMGIRSAEGVKSLHVEKDGHEWSPEDKIEGWEFNV